MRHRFGVTLLLYCAVITNPAIANPQCKVVSGTVASRIRAYTIDLGIKVDGIPRTFLQFDTPLPVTTDGAPDSYNATMLPASTGINSVCDAVSAYRLNGAGDRRAKLSCPATLEAMKAFRDNGWLEPDGLEIAWQGGIMSKIEREKVIPCVFSAGSHQGYFGTKTNLKNGLVEDRGECDINDQIDPRKIFGITIQGGRNFIRDSATQLGDLAIVSMRRSDGHVHRVPAIVVDSGGLAYPAMGTIALNANLLDRSGTFNTRRAVLSLSIDAPTVANVTIIPGSFGFRLQRPFTNENISERLDTFLLATGFSSIDGLVTAVEQCAKHK